MATTYTKSLLLFLFLLVSCKSTKEFSGFSYDPLGVTNTKGKTIELQKKRIIGVGIPKIWVSNEFEGARLNDFYQIDNQTFEVLIEPENSPINNSPWFAFDIWADESRTIYLTLKYKSGKHRYNPKVSGKAGPVSFSRIITDAAYDSTDGSVTFAIYIDHEPKRISAHFMHDILFSDLIQSITKPQKELIAIDTVGFSHQQRPVLEFTTDETRFDKTGVIVLLGRQHPPEVSGYRTFHAFFNELTSNSDLAKEFRKRFTIKAYPMINPDGVANGHWRHNAQGIDLNRDWENFHQPETQAVKEALEAIRIDTTKQVFYGIDFHSTNENILYPIEERISTVPDNLTQQWALRIDQDNPNLNFRVEEFDTSSPISKNWIFHTFGADAVTFEVEDELGENQIAALGKNSAQSLMRLLLEEWNNSY